MPTQSCIPYWVIRIFITSGIALNYYQTQLDKVCVMEKVDSLECYYWYMY